MHELSSGPLTNQNYHHDSASYREDNNAPKSVPLTLMLISDGKLFGFYRCLQSNVFQATTTRLSTVSTFWFGTIAWLFSFIFFFLGTFDAPFDKASSRLETSDLLNFPYADVAVTWSFRAAEKPRFTTNRHDSSLKLKELVFTVLALSAKSKLSTYSYRIWIDCRTGLSELRNKD